MPRALGIPENLAHPIRPLHRIVALHPLNGIPQHLRQRTIARRNNRRAARHRLQRRKTKPLIARGKNKRRRPRIQRRQLRVTGALPAEAEVRGVRRLVMIEAHLMVLIPLLGVFLARGLGTR